ncbi:hypothetical protein ES703_115895 [subsurface metagenome]
MVTLHLSNSRRCSLYKLDNRFAERSFTVTVVGCGGTGGFVAEELCRLLPERAQLVLVDHDRVEPHNLLRQHFYAADVGKFKSQALAERLARQFGRPVGYCVYPYDSELIDTEYGSGMVRPMAQGIIIGCVDNADARRSIATDFNYTNWWIDAGNGYSSGQVLIGNARNLFELEGSFEEVTRQVGRLPMPSMQLPSLLIPPTVKDAAPRDCAESVFNEDQNPVINQAMGMLVLEFIHRLLVGKLSWMGVYLDMEAGTLQTVPAEPEIVARMLGVRVDTLVMKNSKKR